MSTPSMQGHSHASQSRPAAVPYQDPGKMLIQQQPGIQQYRPQRMAGSSPIVPAVQQPAHPPVIDKPISILQHTPSTNQTSDAPKTENINVSVDEAKDPSTKPEVLSTGSPEEVKTVEQDSGTDKVVKATRSNLPPQKPVRSRSQEILKKEGTIQVTKTGSETGAGVTTSSSEKDRKVPSTTRPAPMSYASKASAKPTEAARVPVPKTKSVADGAVQKTVVPASPAEPPQPPEKEDTAIRLGARSQEINDDGGKPDPVEVTEQKKEDVQSESSKSLDSSKNRSDKTSDLKAAHPQAIEDAVETPATPNQTKPSINIVPATPETKVTAADDTRTIDPPKVESKKTEVKADTAPAPAPVKTPALPDKQKTTKVVQQIPQNVVPKSTGKPTKKDTPDSNAKPQSKVPSPSTIASKKAASSDQSGAFPNGTATESPSAEETNSKATPLKPDVQSTTAPSPKV